MNDENKSPTSNLVPAWRQHLYVSIAQLAVFMHAPSSSCRRILVASSAETLSTANVGGAATESALRRRRWTRRSRTRAPATTRL